LEPVKEWVDSGLLQRFYDDKKRWSYHFQTKIFSDKVKYFKTAYTEGKERGCKYLVMERSIFTDKLFSKMLHEDGFMDNLEWDNYNDWFELWKEVLPVTPDLFVYIRPPLEICMERLHRRNRDGECMISEEYQQKLMDKHDEFLNNGDVYIDNKYKKVLVLDDNTHLDLFDEFLGN
jgi:deoxyadenosine/deoxycytidine kinase